MIRMSFLSFAALLLAGCAARQSAPATPPTEEPAGAPCPSRDDPNVTFSEVEPDQCPFVPLFCSEGYAFRDERCGCGCIKEDPLPAGHDTLACTSDADCGLSCHRVGECCGQLCDCTLAYNRETIRLLDEWHAKRCGETTCPVAGCLPTDDVYVAVCTSGRCESVTR